MSKADPLRTSSSSHPVRAADFDLGAVRGEFPILAVKVHGKRLVYLDNAASTQKPKAVIEAVERFYSTEYSNVHRGLHQLSARATESFEGTRCRIQRFLGAADSSEIVFTSGATAALNLVAHSYGGLVVGKDDEVIVTQMEHHSNIVPWQLLCRRQGARLRVAPIDDDGALILDALAAMLNKRTRIVCVTAISNALGTCNPIREIARLAHAAGAVVVVDGAQATAHRPIDVQAIDCDFFAFSGHKMYGPTGIGVLYGKADLLDAMPPFLGGGEMIHSVTFEETTFREPPFRFEAGTPDIAGVIGLGAAVDFLEQVGLERIETHEEALLRYATAKLQEVPGLKIIGRAPDKAGIISFTIDGVHPHDLGTVLDFEGIAVRAGHHCAQPVMDRFRLPATTRASLALYNGRDDIDSLAGALPRALEVLR